MSTQVYNSSSYLVNLVNKDGSPIVSIQPQQTKTLSGLKEGDTFLSSIGNGIKVNIGMVTLLRLAADVAGHSYVGPLKDAVAKPNSNIKLTVGSPVHFRDDKIFSQKTTLRAYGGGTPWVDIINFTEVPLTFQDGLKEPSKSFVIQPGDKYRYEGRYHWGVSYGTYIKNLEGIFSTTQINSPITHLIYGVL